MGKEKMMHVRIRCQKGKEVNLTADVKQGIAEAEGIRLQFTEKETTGGRLGWLQLDMKNEACRENWNLEMEKPVRVLLPAEEKPEKITAMYMYNEWWTRPAFVDNFGQLPEKTQVLFLKYKDRYACLVPMVGKQFKTCLAAGSESEICMEMTAYLGGQRQLDEPLYLLAEDGTLSGAVKKAFTWLAEYKGIRTKTQRRMPEMFRYLGWCSWDAFYTDITEEKVRQKANELLEKKVPVRWILMDDGWLAVEDEMLCDFVPEKEKFPESFGKMVREIKQKSPVRWFGVWHALGGYWGGVRPGSTLEQQERRHLCDTVNGKLLPSPDTGAGFYRDWYEYLHREGIDFVKVDGQSAIPYYYENSRPVCEAARGTNLALESGACYMDGSIINCMGMAMENVLARPASAVSRNSDDFFPEKEGGFAEHLLQNAYNAVYHDELYVCDWDMFWTNHKDCIKHSLLRAVSGGPVYVSDKIGDTNPEILKPLAYEDGELLMMSRAAKPTDDCIFADPMKDGVLKLTNTAHWGENTEAGGIAVYNLSGKDQSFSFTPEDIPGLQQAEEYWVWDYFSQKAVLLKKTECCEGEIKTDGYAWFIVLPKQGAGACLGLLDKYAGFSAVESMQDFGEGQTAVLHETGTVGWLSEKKPVQVRMNGQDMTAEINRKGQLYELRVPSKAGRAVFDIRWEK